MAASLDKIPSAKRARGFYRVMAYVAGVFLLLLVAEMVLKYTPIHLELFAGGDKGLHFAPVVPGPGCEWYSLFIPGVSDCVIESTGEGVNLSLLILIVHGWIYVVYLASCFWLWRALDWPVGRLVTMALGGVVPFLSFFTEAKMHRIANEDIEILERKYALREKKRAQRRAELADAKEG